MLLQHTETKTTVNGCKCSWLLHLCHLASRKFSLYLKNGASTGHSTAAQCLLPVAQSIWIPLTAASYTVSSSETIHSVKQNKTIIFQNVQHDLQNKHVLGTRQAILWCTLWQVPYEGRQYRPQTLHAQFFLISRFIWIPAHKRYQYIQWMKSNSVKSSLNHQDPTKTDPHLHLA